MTASSHEPRGKPLRVAIFNDGRDTLATLKRLFEQHGHSAYIAQLSEMRDAGHEAGDFIHRHRADVVVFDVGLPYVCNWDFGTVLQLLPGAVGVPFVFTTANKAILDELRGEATIAFELTGTPRNLARLLSLVYQAVGRPADA